MRFEERIKIKAPPEAVFSLYENVSGWADWDPDVVSAAIEGEFQAGSAGKLKPAKGPEAKIVLTEVTKNTSFTTTSKLPLCTMRFEHELIPTKDETEVVHRVIFSGVLSPLFGFLIGSGIKKGLPSTLQGLKEQIDAKSWQDRNFR